MNKHILELNGLSEDILGVLSYESKLGLSLKKNLHYFDRHLLLQELIDMTEWFDGNTILSDLPVDYRIKSLDSFILKYDRYFPNHQTKKVFNDILSFRAICNSYDDVSAFRSEQFRVADMYKGKSKDDGYRGVHVYYQKSNRHYPIEIQFNTRFDRQLNDWLYEYLYKKSLPDSVGKEMRFRFESGRIRNKTEFEEALNEVLSCCERP